MIRAAFFDMDGTLISHRLHDVPQSARVALTELRSRGVKVFAATGRHVLELQRLPVWEIPMDGYVTLNGQLCLDGRGEPFYSKTVQAEDEKEIVDLFCAGEVPVKLIQRDRIYINRVNGDVCRTQADISTPVPEVEDYEGGPIYQLVLYADEPTAGPVLERLKHCRATRWGRTALDVFPADGGKAAGIQKTLQRYGLSREEIIAFGDGENDADMLAYAGLGVAMGNAVEALKARADYVTAPVDEDGIWLALRHFGAL